MWVGTLKSLYDGGISAVDDIFDQQDLSTETPMEKVYGPQEGLC